MKMFFAAAAVCVAALLSVAAPVWATVTSIPGTSVGLDHEPEFTLAVKGETDRNGTVSFTGLKPGRYAVVLIDPSKLKVPAVVTVTGGSAKALVSEPIAEGKPGSKAYVLGKDGHRLVIEIAAPRADAAGKPAPGGTITVKVETVR